MPKEYIEREALMIAYQKSLHKDTHKTFEASRIHAQEHRHIMRILENAPAADVVEVVRCKDCKYAKELTQAEEQIYTNDCIMCTQIHPDGNRIAMFLNGFCSYGVRKDGA